MLGGRVSLKKLLFDPKVKIPSGCVSDTNSWKSRGYDNQKFVYSVSLRHRFVSLCSLFCVFCFFGNDPLPVKHTSASFPSTNLKLKSTTKKTENKHGSSDLKTDGFKVDENACVG